MTIAFTLSGPMSYPANTWHELSWVTFGSNDFFDFCSNVTNIDTLANIPPLIARDRNTPAPISWFGGYAVYLKDVVKPGCASGDYNNSLCFGTLNASFWVDTASSASRSYRYLICIEQGACSGPILCKFRYLLIMISHDSNTTGYVYNFLPLLKTCAH